MRRLLVVVLAGLLGGVAVSSSAARSAKFVYFRMPSKKIACAYTSGFGAPFLRCDLLTGLKPKPHGRCTEGVWSAVSMTRRGKARAQCISDTVYNSKAPFLRYGKTWRYGGFTCKSKRTGLTCSNLAGHGFFLSQQNWSVH